jgi:hypothetical protein
LPSIGQMVGPTRMSVYHILEILHLATGEEQSVVKG